MEERTRRWVPLDSTFHLKWRKIRVPRRRWVLQTFNTRRANTSEDSAHSAKLMPIKRASWRDLWVASPVPSLFPPAATARTPSVWPRSPSSSFPAAMGDQNQLSGGPNRSGNGGDAGAVAAAEPVRTRWTPKPEQILILESIFNSGMVNPPKDETVRIRKLLEKFGSVGDANVFYWFQNRRSRSRRRQRQMQAGLQAGIPFTRAAAGGATLYEATSPSTSSTSSSNSSRGGFVSLPTTAAACTTATSCWSPSLLPDDGAEDLFSISRQMGIRDSNTDQTPIYSPALAEHSSTATSLCFHSGLVTVFINGILQEVPREPFDVRAVFGQDVMLVHSSGELVPMDDYGILFQGLFAGETYFLVTVGSF
ncbi:hypothetical protein Taro_010235 [Colocasia esculenta]|uniref:Homeobox domain-containing protein n=1 Tax=Colocasia esculenta TaxID=4460 RepID=A0A843U6A5_COLES|nr:hypothetical protein [Colocasia esculenta]